MSIIPAGKRKAQVSQGALKHESFLDSVLFEKLGQASALIDNPAKKKQQLPGDDMQDVMNSGGLDHNDQAAQQEMDRNPPPEAGVQDRQPGIAPAGGGAGGGAPADQFLGPAPVDESQQGVNPYDMEVQKIRQYIGYQNYGLKLDPQKDGSLQIVVIPPAGQPVDIANLLTGLKQVTQGEWKGEETPAMAQGGPVTLRYVPQSMSTPQKVEKR